MKRLFLLTCSLIAFIGSSWAQHWTVDYSVPADETPAETYVYALLQLPSAAAADQWENYSVGSDGASSYEIAAFIEGDVRAVATAPEFTMPGGPTVLWRLRVKGTEGEASDMPDITFKVYNTSTRAEYAVEATLPFDGLTNEASDPFIIQLDEPTSLSLDEIRLNVGETCDLMELLNEQNTLVPENIEWIRIPEQYSISNHVLTALQPAPGGVTLAGQAGSLFFTTKVYIMQPATSLTLNGAAEMTVNIGDEDGLWEFLNNCYTILPENTTDRVTWTSANESVVGIVPIGVGGTGSLSPIDAGDAVLTGTAGQLTIQVTVHVVVPVTGLSTRFTEDSYIECSVGDDLTQYFVDGQVFSVLPATATNKGVTFALSNDVATDVVTIANGQILAAKAGTSTIVITSQDNEDVRCVVNVRVHNDYQTVSFVKNPLPVRLEGSFMDIGSQLSSNIVFGPEDATGFYDGRVQVQSDNSEVVTIGDVLVMNGVDVMANALQEGTATITVKFLKKDYLQATFTPTQSFTTEVTGTFDVEVSQGLSGISVQLPEDMMVDSGDEVLLQVFPEPEGLELNPDYITVEFQTEGGFSGWTPLMRTSDWMWDPESGSCMTIVEPTAPLTFQVTVSYDDSEQDIHLQTTSDPYSIGVNYDFTEGWEWRNFYFGNPADYDLSELFETGLEEIRTEDQQMLNDSEYGFFGDLDLLVQNRCFKVNMSENSTFPMYSGSLNTTCETTIHPGWNWIPNPFFYNRGLNEIFNEAFMPTEGDRIMSKDLGFADYSEGQWTGSLTGLSRGQGYLYYSNNPDNVTMSFADESTMPGENTAEPPHSRTASMKAAKQGVRRVAANTAFSYNPARFRDNMGIVALVDGIQNPEDYSVVAFVGDECRGEGVCVEGKMFITVHADRGEQISFRLCNNYSGQMFAIDETVKMASMLGSLKAPFKMTCNTVTTGIETMTNDQWTMDNYDLGGRRIDSHAKVIQLQRANNGTVRKVVK